MPISHMHLQPEIGFS